MDLKRYFVVLDADGNEINDCEVYLRADLRDDEHLALKNKLNEKMYSVKIRAFAEFMEVPVEVIGEQDSEFSFALTALKKYNKRGYDEFSLVLSDCEYAYLCFTHADIKFPISGRIFCDGTDYNIVDLWEIE